MNIPTPTAADKTGALYVTRANYDRFIAAGVVYQSAGLLAARESGRWVFVSDATPAEQGSWWLEPLVN
jgi:hypothetical protein